MISLDLNSLETLFRRAINEDLGDGDLTSKALVAPEATAVGEYRAKESMVVCGLSVAREVVRLVDTAIEFGSVAKDGDRVQMGALLARVRGGARSILAAERTSLNFLQRLSGIATLTRAYVSALDGTRARVLDTRKTAPGLRILDKYAVACGGGINHRVGLFDAVLIKSNHLAFRSGVGDAVTTARAAVAPPITVEVEVRDLAELKQALRANAERVLLDNFSPEATREAVRIVGGKVPVESSGGITLDNIRRYAEAGVDFISVGALTHSVIAADIHLLVRPG